MWLRNASRASGFANAPPECSSLRDERSRKDGKGGYAATGLIVIPMLLRNSRLLKRQPEKLSRINNLRYGKRTMQSLLWTLLAMAGQTTINIDALWDFRDPAASEARFQAALAGASPSDTLILKTQIARAFSLRSEFAEAEALLREIEESAEKSNSAEVLCRFHLESGRVLVSATRPASSDDAERTKQARRHYQNAFQIADASELDALAVDAIHMMAFVDPEPAEQVKWAKLGLAIALRSTQHAAQKWEASMRHNMGYALHQLGSYEEALTQFKLAAQLREQQGSEWQIHVARWMIAWTLRHLDRIDEALVLQHELEAEREAIGEPDPYVFEELAALYEAKNMLEESARYEGMRKSSP